MACGIKRQLRAALTAAEQDIADHARTGGFFGRGVANEGYAGGYAQACRDVLAALDGVPASSSRFWPEEG